MTTMLEKTMLEQELGASVADRLFIICKDWSYADQQQWLAKFCSLLISKDKDILASLKYRGVPVGVQEFMEGKFYLNKSTEIYPEVMRQLIELNSGRYDEAVITGGIGSAKTTIALYSQCYQLYRLSMLRSPHALMGLDRSSEIKIIFQNIKEKLAKDVIYARFKSMVQTCPYFIENFPYDKGIDSMLKFPHRIEVEAVSGSETATIGQNVIGGIIDEVNFMSVISNSKQSVDGGVYDQAIELYNSIARRRKSRFMKAGYMPGLLCTVSSKRVPGQFTDIKQAEALSNPRIFVYDKRVWDIKPNSFTSGKFKVFIGSDSKKPRLIREDEIIPKDDLELIDDIPREFEQEFKDDIIKALRDIAGRSTLATHPFLPDREAVIQNFHTKIPNLITQPWVDFAEVRPSIRLRAIKNPEMPRYVHLDLAITGDSAGMCIGHVPRFVNLNRAGTIERLPQIAIDLVMEVKPPRNGEILFYKLREVLYKLTELGMNIKWISLDSFQSKDTMQVLRQRGYSTGLLSMDTSPIPYEFLKTALYDNRMLIPAHEKLQHELLTLEKNLKKNKIDHNAHGSKDVSDALAGVVYGLSTRREVWSMHGADITPNFMEMINKRDNLESDDDPRIRR
jgi:hypothetical protein